MFHALDIDFIPGDLNLLWKVTDLFNLANDPYVCL